jgi:hypothetical protein
MKTAFGHAVRDRAASQPGRDELRARHDPVLPGREACDRWIARPLGDLLNATRVLIGRGRVV